MVIAINILRYKLTLEIGNTVTISERVSSGELDIGICTAPDLDLGLKFHPLFTEKLGLLLPDTHPLAAVKNLICAGD
ncbi:LysR family transcriptional regulator substrate-binding protein [Effusibacillus consociatus]|uniref:LysR family transcriptional regulator substrate-binding protein n=1 Tax=Effusibacillus consociatus TaxID=1117041 RepID=A0ABV9PVT5_9BACL